VSRTSRVVTPQPQMDATSVIKINFLATDETRMKHGSMQSVFHARGQILRPCFIRVTYLRNLRELRRFILRKFYAALSASSKFGVLARRAASNAVMLRRPFAVNW